MAKSGYKSKFSVNNVCYFLVCFCMFLAALNFIDRYYYFMFMAFFAFLIIPKTKIRVNMSSIFILVVCLSILVFDPTSHKSITNIIRPFTFFIAYTLGYSLLNSGSTLIEAERKLKSVVLILSSGAFAHFVLNMLVNLGQTNRDMLIDFWTGNISSATSQACLACMSVAVIAAEFFSEHKPIGLVLSFAVLAIIISYNLVLAGRTLFLMLICILCIAFFYQNHHNKKGAFKKIIIVAIIIMLFVCIYNANIFNLKTTFENSNLYFRFVENEETDVMNSGREMRKALYFENFSYGIWGGSKIRSEVGVYAHDLYLDTYDQASIFALFGIVLYIISSIIRVLCVLCSRTISFKTKQLTLCFYITVNVLFFLEPIILGVPWLLAAYLIVDGAVAYLIKVSKNFEIAPKNSDF